MTSDKLTLIRVGGHFGPYNYSLSVLTLPGLKARGFLVQSVDLLVDVTTNEYRSFCPQALISACPTVFKLIPACFNPFSKMLIAALRSRSNTAPQQIWVLVDSDFLTILPQAEQSWEVY